VTSVDPRLVSALQAQLEGWRAALAAGAERVGWKLGKGDAEKIGPGPVIGHLTSATRLEPGASYRPPPTPALHADAELALELGRDVEPGCGGASARDAITACGAAIELVDLAASSADPEQIVADNVFHLAHALGPMRAAPPPGEVGARLIVSGEERAWGTATPGVGELVGAVAVLLSAVGERLQAGDRLITGSIVQVPVERGSEVVADLGPLGRVGLRTEG